MTEQKKEELTFDNLGISEKLLSTLKTLKFTSPTPIQHQAIPVGMAGKDLVGIAQTGTGKTLAFGLPMLQKLAGTKDKGLVLLPTRELAVQVEESFRKFGFGLGVDSVVLIGGENIQRQFMFLKRNPQIIIATPGRLNDHLVRGSVNLSAVKILVLDEADLMFDMGFAPQINKIIAKIPKERQTMLFSATMPSEIIGLATANMKTPIRIEVAPAGQTADGVDQEILLIKKEDRLDQLDKLLGEYEGSVLVFCRTKRNVKAVTEKIVKFGYKAAEIHSNRSQSQRQQALNSFKKGFTRVLVATDIAARGIDVSNIQLVVNFDLPDDSGDYVHRIGRTARAGKTGKAISFAAPDQIGEIRQIERLIKKSIPLTALSGLSAPKALAVDYSKNNFPYNKRRSGGYKSKSFSRPNRGEPRYLSADKKPFAKSGFSKDKKFGFSGSSYSRPDSRKSGFSSNYKSGSYSSGVSAKTENNFAKKEFSYSDKPRRFDSRPGFAKKDASFDKKEFGYNDKPRQFNSKSSSRPFSHSAASQGFSRPDFKKRTEENESPRDRNGVFSTDRERFRASMRPNRPEFGRRKSTRSRTSFR